MEVWALLLFKKKNGAKMMPKLSIDFDGTIWDVNGVTYKYICNTGLGAVFECTLGGKADMTNVLYSTGIKHCQEVNLMPTIKSVKFNNPATIVFWTDGTKTVVKCGDDDTFDPEKGLAMAIAKKALGNCGNYFNKIKRWIDEYSEEDSTE